MEKVLLLGKEIYFTGFRQTNFGLEIFSCNDKNKAYVITSFQDLEAINRLTGYKFTQAELENKN